MDTELARTFLAIVAEGSFLRAADRLHVSQSTVSTRIQTLEAELGAGLFVRNKAGTSLTPAGRRFQRHAATLVRTLEQARNEVGIPRDFSATLKVGGRLGLWQDFLVGWLAAMRARLPEVALQAEIGFEEDLMQGLVEGRLDLAVMYTPQSRPGLRVERLFDERLVLVGTAGDGGPQSGAGYLYIDWGPEFFARHAASFPDFTAAGLSANIGWLGLRYILDHGGSGYFPLRLVSDHLAAGRVALLAGAPAFDLPAYVVHAESLDAELAETALAEMRRLAGAEGDRQG